MNFNRVITAREVLLQETGMLIPGLKVYLICRMFIDFKSRPIKCVWYDIGQNLEFGIQALVPNLIAFFILRT